MLRGRTVPPLMPAPFLCENPSGMVFIPRQVSRDFMKQILVFLYLALVLVQSGCAVSPPIDQQTLEQQRQAQAEKKSDAFARGLPQ